MLPEWTFLICLYIIIISCIWFSLMYDLFLIFMFFGVSPYPTELTDSKWAVTGQEPYSILNTIMWPSDLLTGRCSYGTSQIPKNHWLCWETNTRTYTAHNQFTMSRGDYLDNTFSLIKYFFYFSFNVYFVHNYTSANLYKIIYRNHVIENSFILLYEKKLKSTPIFSPILGLR